MAAMMKSSAVCMTLLSVAWGSGLFSQSVMAHGWCSGSFLSTMMQLFPCRPAVAPFSPMPPSELCCNVVKALGQPCLCAFINGPPITGMDRRVARQLPVKCNANFKPCNVPCTLLTIVVTNFDPVQELHNRRKFMI